MLLEFLVLDSYVHVAVLVALVCMALYFRIARAFPSHRYYYWFVAAAGVQVLHWGSLLHMPMASTVILPEHLLWIWLGVPQVYVFTAGLFNHLLLPERDTQRLQKGFALFYGVAVLGMTVLVLQGVRLDRNWAMVVSYLQNVVLAGLMFKADQREPLVGHAWVGAALLLLPIEALYLAVSEIHDVAMRQLSMGPVLVVMLLLLPAAHVRQKRELISEIRRREQAERDLAEHNDSLASTVSARTAELEQALRAAKAADVAKGRFLAVISHEVRTPLSGLLGMLEVLEGEVLPTDQKDLLETARLSGQQLRHLLDEVIDLSKVEAGMLALHLAPCDALKLGKSSVQSFEAAAAAKGLWLHLEAGPGPHWLSLDAVKVKQMLDNLISNAVKFTQDGHVKVVLRLVEANSGPDAVLLEIEVADTGPGVAPQDREAIFEPFVQAGAPSLAQRQPNGSGLGLALCRNLARAMGGDVLFSPGHAVGSVFLLRIPTRRVPPQAWPAELPHGDGLGAREAGDLSWLKDKRVLVVDDNLIIRKVLDRLLKGLGASVTLAEGGAAALQQAKSVAFDAVLMDVSMPQMNGLEVTRALRGVGHDSATPRSVPIIGISAHALAGDREECLEAGMTAYLTKPIERGSLVRALEAVLGTASPALV